MSALTLEAFEEATRELYEAVGGGHATTLMMRKDVHVWLIASIKQAEKVRAARRHPMLRHMTRRQFDRRVRIKKIPYPKKMPSNWPGWTA